VGDLVDRLRELDADAATHNAAATLLALTDLLPDIIAALDTQPWDDPSLDGTDGAHPAWWRGDDHGYQRALDAQPVGLDVALLGMAMDQVGDHVIVGQPSFAQRVADRYAALASEPQP
jgi:hypothetical protein